MATMRVMSVLKKGLSWAIILHFGDTCKHVHVDYFGMYDHRVSMYKDGGTECHIRLSLRANQKSCVSCIDRKNVEVHKTKRREGLFRSSRLKGL